MANTPGSQTNPSHPLVYQIGIKGHLGPECASGLKIITFHQKTLSGGPHEGVQKTQGFFPICLLCANRRLKFADFLARNSGNQSKLRNIRRNRIA